MDLPDGFHPWPGNRKPRTEGPFNVVLRNGWNDRRPYMRNQLVWTHDGSSGDIVAIRKG